MKPILVITGISSGIGHVFLKSLCLDGHYSIIGTARKSEDFQIFLKYQTFKGVICDLESSQSREDACNQIIEYCAGMPLYALIHNAGIAVSGPQKYLLQQDLYKQFEINVFAVMDISRRLLPIMNKGSRIIHISSVSALITSPFVGAYASSKKAMEILGDALRRELRGTGIHVVHVRPGPILTPIWDKALNEKIEHFQNTEYAPLIQEKPQRIQSIQKSALPVTIVIQELNKILRATIPPISKIIARRAWIFHVLQWLPDRWLDTLLTSESRKWLGRP